jgi:hypothetical protein
MTRKRPVKLELFLRDYMSLTEDGGLRGLTEEQLTELLTMELNGRKRRSFIERIHSTLSTKRTRRERAEFLARCEQN